MQEVVDLTAGHVTKDKGLYLQSLTMEQAAIIQAHTGVPLVTNEVLNDHIVTRLLALRMTEEPTENELKYLAEEDFDRIRPYYRDDHPILAKQVVQILLDKLDNDPFACWDSRVDVILACHLNDLIIDFIKDELKLYRDTEVTFTERPGDRPQTWIVMARADPIERQLKKAIDKVHELTRNSVWEDGRFTLMLPMSLPYTVEPKFKAELKQLYALDHVDVLRERFTRHQVKIVLIKPQSWGAH